MSLFTELLRLHGGRRPTEDFFTEIVAVLLRRRPGLAVEWLAEMGVTDLQGLTVAEVETQVIVPAIGDERESRPDLHLTLKDEGRTVVVLIESKVGSQEHGDQLNAYATHLASLDVDECWLIYVTRDYDPKDPAQVTAGGPVQFMQSRWAAFFKVLSWHGGDDLVDETLAFMKEQRMHQIDRLDANDLLAIQGMPRALAFMDEVLDGAVAMVNQESAWLPSNLSVRWSDLRENDRYVLFHDLKPRLTLLFGFFFKEGDEPRLEVFVEAAPSIQSRPEVLTGLRDASPDGSHWSAYNLDGASAWSGIRTGTTLFEFLGQESHLFSMQEFLAKRLEEVRALRANTPAFR